MVQGKAFKPTDADRDFVERSVMAGTPINDIAGCLNITDDTLRRRFRYEITTARAQLKGKAAKVISDHLDDGSLDAAKFVLARLSGWVERQAIDHSNTDGSLRPNLALTVEDIRKEMERRGIPVPPLD